MLDGANSVLRGGGALNLLKVHKHENFVGSIFEFFTIFAFNMFKY
jgi:hypothetical protein